MKCFYSKHTINAQNQMSRYLFLLFFIFAGFLFGNDIDLGKLEKEVFKNNRAGKYELSQRKLSELLSLQSISKEEEGEILFLMANTYRSVNDFMMCVDYLKRAEAVADGLPKENPLRMKIDYEFAFVYFDNKDYEKSRVAMENIASKNYKNPFPEDRAFILIQEGYLLIRDRKLKQAEIKYYEALAIMKDIDYCNLPIVMVKLMELYSIDGQVSKVEKTYEETLKITDSCNILKYRIFATAEMEKLYKQNKMFDKANVLGMRLDSLRKLEGLENKISEMHVQDRKFLEKDKTNQNETFFWEKIFTLIAFVAIAAITIFYIIRSRRKFQKDKLKMEEEIELMRSDLKLYSQLEYGNQRLVNPQALSDNFEKLTQRQKDLLDLMAEGFSNKEIADKLFIAESTVKYHIKNIYSLLELKDRKDFFRKMSQK